MLSFTKIFATRAMAMAVIAAVPVPVSPRGPIIFSISSSRRLVARLLCVIATRGDSLTTSTASAHGSAATRCAERVKVRTRYRF